MGARFLYSAYCAGHGNMSSSLRRSEAFGPLIASGKCIVPPRWYRTLWELGYMLHRSLYPVKA
jgi:hypothetical protein